MSVFKSSEVKKSTGLLEWIWNSFEYDTTQFTIQWFSKQSESKVWREQGLSWDSQFAPGTYFPFVTRYRTGPDQYHSDQDQTEVRSRTIGNWRTSSVHGGEDTLPMTEIGYGWTVQLGPLHGKNWKIIDWIDSNFIAVLPADLSFSSEILRLFVLLVYNF